MSNRGVFKRALVVRAARALTMLGIIRERSRRSQAGGYLFFRERSRIVRRMAKKKNPAAVALGRKGGKKGGKARAASLTKEQLSESGRNAVMARWERYYAKKGREKSS